jgi:hypothetical protein
MDRVLLGHNYNNPSQTDNSGFWVSKETVNVTAVAGNSYFYGEIYGYSENFQWTGAETYTYSYFSNRPSIVDDPRSGLRTVKGKVLPPGDSTGALQFTTNAAGHYHVAVLNATSLSPPTFPSGKDGRPSYGDKIPNSGLDEAFIGQDYPILEMKVRKPARKHIDIYGLDPTPGFEGGWDAEFGNPVGSPVDTLRIYFTNGATEETLLYSDIALIEEVFIPDDSIVGGHTDLDQDGMTYYLKIRTTNYILNGHDLTESETVRDYVASTITRIANINKPTNAMGIWPPGTAAVAGKLNNHPYIDGAPIKIELSSYEPTGEKWIEFSWKVSSFGTGSLTHPFGLDFGYGEKMPIASAEWTAADFYSTLGDFSLQWTTSNSTHRSSQYDEEEDDIDDKVWPWSYTERAFPGLMWHEIFLSEGTDTASEWATIEYDFENLKTRVANSSGHVVATSDFYSSSKAKNWNTNTKIDGLKFNFHVGHQGQGVVFDARHGEDATTWSLTGSGRYRYAIRGSTGDSNIATSINHFSDGDKVEIHYRTQAAASSEMTALGYSANAAGTEFPTNGDYSSKCGNLTDRGTIHAIPSTTDGINLINVKLDSPYESSVFKATAEDVGPLPLIDYIVGSRVKGEDYDNQSDPPNQPDIEVDYIRSKKSGIPINFTDTANDSLMFDSNWARTGLIHQTGIVSIGTEYAYANGTSKPSGQSHPGSTSGSISFEELDYIPVVLFQRIDSQSSATDKKAFPGGEKEFSHSVCEIEIPSREWNSSEGRWVDGANTNFGAEFRTFAYCRSSKDHFELTCRNAIARDGYEWLFNYAPQAPYIELEAGGNYDPATEHQDNIKIIGTPDVDGEAWSTPGGAKRDEYINWIGSQDGYYPNMCPDRRWTGLFYYEKFTGTDKGSVLPTFDWANKMGDWNIPQFNSFYQYKNENTSTYKNFKDAIGTSWTEDNTRFLDDSMWMGNHEYTPGEWSNNAMEYKGDIWHPQAPTKTFSERGGLMGYGGWTHDGPRGGTGIDASGDVTTYSRYLDFTGVDTWKDMIKSKETGPIYDNKIYGLPMGEGTQTGGGFDKSGFSFSLWNMLGGSTGWTHLAPRWPGESGPTVNHQALIDGWDKTYGSCPFVPHYNNMRNASYKGLSAILHPDPVYSNYGWSVSDGVYGTQNRDFKNVNILDNIYGYFPFSDFDENFDLDPNTEWGKVIYNYSYGPGLECGYDQPNQSLNLISGYNRYNPSLTPDPGGEEAAPWQRRTFQAYATTPTWGNPSETAQKQGGTKSEEYTITRSYTYPGCTYAYDISNFSGPAHYDAWYENDETQWDGRIMKDYIERDVTHYMSDQEGSFTSVVINSDGTLTQETTSPEEGDERKPDHPPLSAKEQDLQRADKTMINHFRQSYEYNLPGKTPHRDGTLRPIGYGPYPTSVDRSDYGKTWLGSDEEDNGAGFQWNNGEYTGWYFKLESDGTLKRVKQVLKYPTSGLYTRPRGGKVGWGQQITYGMQRHGRDLSVLSQRVRASVSSGHIADGVLDDTLYGGISSLHGDFINTPPGLTKYGSALTINLYPMTAVTTNHNSPQNLDMMGRPINIVPMKSLGFGETNMYSRHKVAIDTYGVPGRPDEYNLFNDSLNRMTGYGLRNYDSTTLDGNRIAADMSGIKKLPNWYYLHGNIFPGMCKADNSLTHWGTVDLSTWGKSGTPSNDRDGEFPLREKPRGHRSGTYMSDLERNLGNDTYNWLIYNGLDGGDQYGYKGGTAATTSPPAADKLPDNIQPFSGTTNAIPEFDPISGDGRYFGGVGGCNGKTPGFGDLLGPSLAVEPTVQELKWNTIAHPIGVVPDTSTSVVVNGIFYGKDIVNSIFYGRDACNNQTSYIGGAPNRRTLIIRPDGGLSGSWSGGVRTPTGGYVAPNINTHGERGITNNYYDWCIGAPQIECNEWDRKLISKGHGTKDLAGTKLRGRTEYHYQYDYDETKIVVPQYRYWVLRIPAGLEAYNG